jgi:AcrR family transcriptional regulator
LRPKDADSAVTLARILSAARALLEEKGPEALSLRGVARRAKMSAGTVSYYFSSLEELCEACLDEHYTRLMAVAARHLGQTQQGKSLQTVLAEAARDLYQFAVAERALLRLQLATAAQRGALGEGRLGGHIQPLLRAVGENIAPFASVKHPSLKIQTLVYAAVRFACASPEERCAFTGVGTDAEANRIIGDHMADLAVLLLAPD